MGDSGSTHADSSRDIKYAFLTVTQQPEDLKTCTVTKLFEGTGHICTGIFRGHCLKNVMDIPMIMWENWSFANEGFYRVFYKKTNICSQNTAN